MYVTSASAASVFMYVLFKLCMMSMARQFRKKSIAKPVPISLWKFLKLSNRYVPSKKLKGRAV